ncbi:opsin-3 [Bombina bombina]|uniref:opsin-3 n=1 Tax=Bombina bombina TaxID=8345 RepID=UPI00235AB83E|nr:opsin-3 [Bombina bombina]
MHKINYSSNNEKIQALYQELFSQDTYDFLALIIAIVGMLGVINNLLVMIIFYKFKRLRTPKDLFFFNVSFSDLFVSISGLVFTFSSCVTRKWTWYTKGCVFEGFITNLFGIVSILTLTCVAYERYIRVLHAKVIDFSWSWRSISFIWLYSFAWAAAPILGWNRYLLEIHGISCSMDWTSNDPNDTFFILFYFLACIVVPVGFMFFCYGRILHGIRKLSRVQNLQDIQKVKIMETEIKIGKIFLLMICTLLICWIPRSVISLLLTYGYKKQITTTTALIPTFLAKSSAAYNPVINIFMLKKV